ncbi:hypothetical protein JOE51_006308 [Bradyrhizobium japonicum]|nr:hypothetical protein [Bradyrhizobium japonicum]
MSMTFSDLVQIFNLADYVRPWLPWTWRVYATSALIWSGILALGSVVALGAHFAVKPKPKVDWQFLKNARPFSSSWTDSGDGKISNYKIQGLTLAGENISGHALHQVSGEILFGDRRKLPLFVVAQGRWTSTDDIEAVPRFAQLVLGGGFEMDGKTWSLDVAPMKPDDFIRSFGGSTVSVTIDGDTESWTFSVEDLRRAVDIQIKEEQEMQLRGPGRQEVRRKRQTP